MEKHQKVERASKGKPLLLIQAEYKAMASADLELPEGKALGALSEDQLIAKNIIGNTDAAEKRI